MVFRCVMLYARDLIRVLLFPLLEASGWISLARFLLTSTVCELCRHGVLRRLMSNCERRGRSRGSMLAPNLLPKAVPHDGPRLLPYLIVRLHRRVVEGLPPPERASQARPSGSAFRERGPYPGHPRPVASLQKRARLLAFRFFAPAPLIPRPVLPGSAQPAHPSSGAGVAPLAALLRRGSYGPFGSLPRDGHDPGAGHREGEGFAQRTVRRSGFLRAQCVEDGVGLRVQGGPGSGSRRGDHSLRSGGGGLRREAHSRGSHSLRPLRCLPGRQGLHGGRVGATLAGGI